MNICTPNGLHAEQSIMALEHRKHVVCEKPLALSAAECDAMTRAAKALKKLNFTWYNYRRVPALALARAGLARAQFVVAKVPAARASAIAADALMPRLWNT